MMQAKAHISTTILVLFCLVSISYTFFCGQTSWTKIGKVIPVILARTDVLALTPYIGESPMPDTQYDTPQDEFIV